MDNVPRDMRYAIRDTQYAIRAPALYTCRERSTNQLLFMQNKPNFPNSQMNVNLYSTMDYENKWQRRVRKNKPNSNPIKSNFKPGDGFSAYYKRDCHVADFTLSAAEGGLAMIFLGAFLQVAARPEKNVGTMNLLVIKSYKFYLNYLLLLSNY